MTAPATTFDSAEFSRWLDRVTGQKAPLTVTPIRGGGSCEMFRVDRLGRPWVVRRAPVATVSDTAHQVVREARIMRVLGQAGVLVPEVLAYSDDPKIIGAPFFVMSYIEGGVIRRDGLPEPLRADTDSHGAIGEELVDTLVRIHAVNWADTELAELSRPEGFLDRQVDRWLSQLSRYRVRDLNTVDTIATWLTKNLPTKGDLTVMHGDYKLDNVIWAPAAPPRVACVVDFEMTTVGDPLIDLAWAMIFWPDEGNAMGLASPDAPNGIDRAHRQSSAALIERYANATGRDMSNFHWYQVFSAWKLAIVLEGSYAKHVRGESQNQFHQFFGPIVEQLLERAEGFTQ